MTSLRRMLRKLYIMLSFDFRVQLYFKVSFSSRFPKIKCQFLDKNDKHTSEGIHTAKNAKYYFRCLLCQKKTRFQKKRALFPARQSYYVTITIIRSGECFLSLILLLMTDTRYEGGKPGSF